SITIPSERKRRYSAWKEPAKCFGTQGADGQSVPQPWLNPMATLPLTVTAKLHRWRTRLAARYSTEGSSNGCFLGMVPRIHVVQPGVGIKFMSSEDY
ncbi:MAG TPA: hypothetical protein VJX94_27945, partial [Stellaceae bacterium]|nr:hypothetical protein [Stellaceae bacterium]